MNPNEGSPAVRRFEDAAGERWEVTWHPQGRKRGEPARYEFHALATGERHVIEADPGTVRSRLPSMSLGDVRQLLAAAKHEARRRT